ncbi:MAG: DUF6438 domain-containing protein [Gemmatimonadaceae bacterium]|nr:DUF6438 domain-containing protein [Gemmatimonadaceae bacterium]
MSVPRALGGTAALLMALVACASARTAGDSGATTADTVSVVTLERGGCRGSCPIYSVQLRPDGRVLFTGTRFVRVIGNDSARVTADAVAAVQRIFAERGFTQMPSEIGYGTPTCGSYATDLPTVALTLRVDDRVHRVRFDEGCRGHPAVLDTLARMIDSTGGTARWMLPTGT